MLYLLLFSQHVRHPALNVLRYQTFRSVLAGLAALALSLALGPLLIQRFRAAHIGQTIREEVPQSHQKKAGTPTMGGLLILASCFVATVLLADPRNPFIWVTLFVMIAFGAIGFSDDYLKLKRGRGQGLSGPQKLFWQFTCAFIAAVLLFWILKLDTHLTFPFFKRMHPDLHWWLYIPLAMIVIVGCSNAVNLTDGLDGLAIGPVMTTGFCYWIFTYVAGNLKFATYLDVPHVEGAGEVAIFCGALIASSMGFLWYNAYPAQVFMGDTGSLTLGGIIAALAIIVRKEWLIPIFCGVFLVESLSVIIQVTYFRYSKKKYGEGRRVFLMSPLHHHYQKLGYHESKIVTRFWIVTILCVAFAIATLKIR